MMVVAMVVMLRRRRRMAMTMMMMMMLSLIMAMTMTMAVAVTMAMTMPGALPCASSTAPAAAVPPLWVGLLMAELAVLLTASFLYYARPSVWGLGWLGPCEKSQ